MAVDTVILRKLIELACNNPNENEANSAARKVCRMIKDDSYAVINSSSQTYRNTYTSPRPPNPAEDWERASREAAERERERVRQAQAAYERQEAARRAAAAERMRKEAEKQRQKVKYKDTTYTNRIRTMNCSSCGLPKNTFYEGPAELFLCSVCRVRKQKEASGT